ncbi:MAG: hypothetical protein DMF05_11945 [Verrucomicrobia bacterium]|nr:MAG: hypothetical protein DMF05_11945 [Verrucomicrobiota bacterium]
MRSYLNLKTCEQCSPRERNDLRGEKFTAPINRTKTSFVNRFGSWQRGSQLVRGHYFAFKLFASISFFPRMRVLLAGILGGIVMFIWTSIAHMALPLGEAGITEIPNESAVLNSMQSNIGDKTGLYIFPGLGVGKTPADRKRMKP